jgi:hypothetical protein
MLLDDLGMGEIVVDGNAGIVDEHVEVFDRAGRARDLCGVGDVEHQRRHALVGALERAARRRVNLLRAASKRLIDKRAADAAVGAGDQNTLVRDVHSVVL